MTTSPAAHAGMRLAWVGYNAPPYRRPVWAALGRQSRLRVTLLQNDKMLERAGRRGADWSLMSQPGELGFEMESAHSVRIARGESSYYVLLEPAGRIVQNADCIILGGWESPAFWQLRLAARRRGIRCVGFYESTVHTSKSTSGPIAAARAKFFRSLHAVVVPGAAAEQAVLAMGVAPERIHRGFNAVDVEKFAQRHTLHAEAPAATPADEGHHFLYVGQLIQRKNLDTMLRAFALIREPSDTLTIVGTGELREELGRLAQQLALGTSVKFAGPLNNDDLPGVMQNSDSLILPSFEEVWGLVANEALAAGCNVVVSRSAGVAASIEGMRGVYLVDPEVKSLSGGLSASREARTGPILDPEILQHTPAAFAAVFAQAASAEPPSSLTVE